MWLLYYKLIRLWGTVKLHEVREILKSFSFSNFYFLKPLWIWTFGSSFEYPQEFDNLSVCILKCVAFDSKIGHHENPKAHPGKQQSNKLIMRRWVSAFPRTIHMHDTVPISKLV